LKDGPKPAKMSRPALSAPPEGTEGLLWREQAAAALSISPRRFDQLVAAGEIVAPDGRWQGKRFWLKSTINEFLRGLANHGRCLQEAVQPRTGQTR